MVLPLLGFSAAIDSPPPLDLVEPGGRGVHAPRADRPSALPRLRVVGRNLVDPAGGTVLLRGANLGNWLVVEFWMLALGGRPPKDQYDLEAILARRFGEAEKDRLMDVYRASWITERDFKILPTFGFNCVRLPMNYRLMEDDRRPFQLKPDAWRWIDRAVGLAEANGMYTILDLHGVQGGQNVNDHTGRSGQNRLKDSPEDQRRMAWLWGEIAKRYRARPAVVAYDVWNEPYDTPQSLYRPIFEPALRAIRAVDKDKLVYAMGHYGGFSAYGDPKANGWRNVGFEMHYYPGLFGGGNPTVKTQQKHLASLAGVQKTVAALDVPFLVGEMNVVFDRAGGADMMRRTYDRHAEYGWGTTMWSYKLQTRDGGIGDAFWGMVANAKPAPQVDFSTAPKRQIETYFRSFATQPLVVNARLQKALGDPKYEPMAFPMEESGRTGAPQGALAGWTQTDVGGALAGGLEARGEDVALYGGGADVWGTRDEFRFLSREVEGDFTVEALLVGVEDVDQYTKAGLMARASTAPDAPFALLSCFPNGGLQLAHRDAPGGEASAPPDVPGAAKDVRLRLVRKGGTITASAYRNHSWKTVASIPNRLPRRVLVGPIACSHDASQLVKVDYRSLRLRHDRARGSRWAKLPPWRRRTRRWPRASSRSSWRRSWCGPRTARRWRRGSRRGRRARTTGGGGPSAGGRGRVPKVEEIVLTEFRGASGETRLTLDPGKRLAIFYGENGTGKSSLIDGLDVALTGEVGSLADVSTGGVRARYLRSLGATGTTRAAVRVDGAWWEGTLNGSAVVRQTPGPPLAVHVLRRRQIQRLIEATDAQKYAVIEPCLGLGGPAKAEEALLKALRAATGAHKEALERRGAAERALEALCVAEGGTGRPLEWARRQTATPVAELRAEGERLEAKERRWDAADEAATAWHAAIREALASTGALRTHDASGVAAMGFSATEAAALADLLRRSRDWVSAHGRMCPVCEGAAPLVSDLDTRLESLAAVQAHVRAGDALREAATDRQRRATLAGERLMAAARELAAWIELPEGGEPGAAAHALAGIEGGRRELRIRREAVARSLSAAGGVATNLRLYDEAAGRAEALGREATCLRATAEIVAGERKAFVQRALDELQEDVARMYETVHPDEPAAAGRMTLDEAKSGSLRHTVRLGEHDGIAPGPYFSESHQDTLALCILLAVAKRRGGRDAILLLDDVLLSVDDRHMDRVQTLIVAEMEGFGHVVVTTHHRRFFARFVEDETLADRVELRHFLPLNGSGGIVCGHTRTKAVDPTVL